VYVLPQVFDPSSTSFIRLLTSSASRKQTEMIIRLSEKSWLVSFAAHATAAGRSPPQRATISTGSRVDPRIVGSRSA
jgi:hypothetical protein